MAPGTGAERAVLADTIISATRSSLMKILKNRCAAPAALLILTTLTFSIKVQKMFLWLPTFTSDETLNHLHDVVSGFKHPFIKVLATWFNRKVISVLLKSHYIFKDKYRVKIASDSTRLRPLWSGAKSVEYLRIPMFPGWVLSDEWLLKYEIVENLHIKLRTTGTGMWKQMALSGYNTLLSMYFIQDSSATNWIFQVCKILAHTNKFSSILHLEKAVKFHQSLGALHNLIPTGCIRNQIMFPCRTDIK